MWDPVYQISSAQSFDSSSFICKIIELAYSIFFNGAPRLIIICIFLFPTE
jgi:hypothetical protein